MPADFVLYITHVSTATVYSRGPRGLLLARYTRVVPKMQPTQAPSKARAFGCGGCALSEEERIVTAVAIFFSFSFGASGDCFTLPVHSFVGITC